MAFSGRAILFMTLMLAGFLVAAAGIVLPMMDVIGWPAGAVVIAGGVLLGVLASFLRPRAESGSSREDDPDDIDHLDDDRLRELIRGTSLFLREMDYRYSIRPDPRTAADRVAFTTEVNSVRLGFVPVVITDNTNDRQGLGYVAYVHDGARWRGPGLPCPGDSVEAVRHAARCVSPLANEDETRYDG